MPDMRLVRKGRNEPLAGLVQEGRTHLELGTGNAAELNTTGWFADDTTDMRELVTRLDTDAAAKADAVEVVLGLGHAEQMAIDEVKAFIRRLRNALPRALRESRAEEVTASSFYAGGRLGRSTPKLSRYLADIRPSVVRLDTALARHFNGTAPSTILDTVKNALDGADATQEAALAALPAETQSIYEAKGRLLEMIEDMNRAGKSAFDGNATKMAMFNKDILLRARKARKKPT